MTKAMNNQAYLGGGCFWCTEAIFQQLRGVSGMVAGYAGGQLDQPSYEAGSGGDTGHAEVIEVTFDPSVISYDELLRIFFAVHDPTTPNRQGHDVGSQYRSIILYVDEAQRAAAAAILHDFAPALWDQPVVTELQPLDKFWPAEAYHQNYFAKNPAAGYCLAVINPKVSKFRQQFADRLKD